jgi:TM2 domain-containing membrane protein YozV
VKRKRTWLAALLSALWPGLGQLYCGKWGQGLALLALQVISLTLIFQFIGLVTTPLIWLWAVIGAYRLAGEVNEAGLKVSEKPAY